MSATNTAAITTDQHSPRHSGGDNIISSPQSRRVTRTVSPPWTQIVRGELDSIPAVPTSPSFSLPSSTSMVESIVASLDSIALPSVEGSSENSNGLNAGKKAAWNKPSNGIAEIGPVMGAVSWPALSETTRPSAKSASESMKGLSDGSVSSATQGTWISSYSSQNQVNTNANSNSTPTRHPVLPRQRSWKYNGPNHLSNGGPSHQPRPPGPVIETAPSSPSVKDPSQRSGFPAQSNSVNDHPQQRNSFRFRNGGSHRGDGSSHHNHGGRRDQEHGNQEWNAHRNFNGPPQRAFSRILRPTGPPPPPNTAPFIPPPPMRPFSSPIIFPELAPSMVYVGAPPPPDTFRGVPFVAPMPYPAAYFPAPDPQLHTKIVNQIDYYFSNENLVKDIFLRQNMDSQGWVPINLIAGFNKVMRLTQNIQLILDALGGSAIVEVQGDKLRRRNDWRRWLMPSSAQLSNGSQQSQPFPDGANGKSSVEASADHSSSARK